MNETDALTALTDLGLTSYEAEVFVALQKLGIGSASDVDRIADVPRSQVYGSADKLADRGLVEVQQSDPMQYRPVGLDEARELLRNRYEHREARAFDYLEHVRTTREDVDEKRDDIWTIHGRDAVTRRTIQLVADANERVLYGASPVTIDEDLYEALVEAASTGVEVTVVSADEEVLERFDGETTVTTRGVGTDLTPKGQDPGRLLVVDDETVLLSILGDETVPDLQSETAIWSARSGFAAVIIRLLDVWFDEHLDY